MTTTTYQVSGMTCEHCVSAVNSELSGLAGVSGVRVDLVPGGLSRVTVTSEVPLPAADVTGALDEAGGYQLSAQSRGADD
jgi:copper chaperone CopZ